jgi:hypothetical protein
MSRLEEDIKLIKSDIRNIDSVSDSSKNDIGFMNELIDSSGDGWYLQFGGEEARCDFDLCKKSVISFPGSIKFVGKISNEDYGKLVKIVCTEAPCYMHREYILRPRFFNTKVANYVLPRYGYALKYFPFKIRDNMKMVQLAITSDPKSIKYASERIRNIIKD